MPDNRNVVRDSDGDRWTDLLERRLATDPEDTDTDGDGADDPADPAPRGAEGSLDRCDCDAASMAAVLTLSAAFPGTSAVFVAGANRRLSFEAAGGPVLALSEAELHRICTVDSCPGRTYIFDAEAGWLTPGVICSFDTDATPADGTGTRGEASAVVTVMHAYGDAIGLELLFTCVADAWVPVGIAVRWIA
jgi:hypothetical protein